jgi:hypothetical protein
LTCVLPKLRLRSPDDEYAGLLEDFFGEIPRAEPRKEGGLFIFSNFLHEKKVGTGCKLGQVYREPLTRIKPFALHPSRDRCTGTAARLVSTRRILVIVFALRAIFFG